MRSPKRCTRKVADRHMSAPELIAMGSFLNTDTTRIVAKRIVLSGHPFKVHRKTATVRYMFFNAGEWVMRAYRDFFLKICGPLRGRQLLQAGATSHEAWSHGSHPRVAWDPRIFQGALRRADHTDGHGVYVAVQACVSAMERVMGREWTT